MICFFEAKARQIPLYTNDKKLLNYSLREKVNAYWGLELLITLFKGGYIAKDEVLGIAQNICERTPYPTEKIMDEFRRRI